MPKSAPLTLSDLGKNNPQAPGEKDSNVNPRSMKRAISDFVGPTTSVETIKQNYATRRTKSDNILYIPSIEEFSEQFEQKALLTKQLYQEFTELLKQGKIKETNFFSQSSGSSIGTSVLYSSGESSWIGSHSADSTNNAEVEVDSRSLLLDFSHSPPDLPAYVGSGSTAEKKSNQSSSHSSHDEGSLPIHDNVFSVCQGTMTEKRVKEKTVEQGENAVGENVVGENVVGENVVGENVVGENVVGEEI